MMLRTALLYWAVAAAHWSVMPGFERVSQAWRAVEMSMSLFVSYQSAVRVPD